MSRNKSQAGTIAWVDLTVPHAEKLKDFYSSVVGWKSEPVSMGDYDDYNMTDPETGEPRTGVCHKRGVNKDLPSQWMVYFFVDDIEQSVDNCKEAGGKLIAEIKSMGDLGRYCVIEDPAGVVCALFEGKQ